MSGRIQTVSGPCDDRKRLQPFVGVGHMAMMAFNTDIMQQFLGAVEVCPPDVVPESSISHSLLYIISLMMMNIQ